MELDRRQTNLEMGLMWVKTPEGIYRQSPNILTTLVWRCPMSVITPELLARFDVPGPRYTSYPTADRFVEAFTEADAILALEQRRQATRLQRQPLSLYVHIPFCESLCYYCACNKIITKHKDRAATYLRYLSREVELQVAHLGSGHAVSQLHLGGGTPTFLSDDELRELLAMLRRLAPVLKTLNAGEAAQLEDRRGRGHGNRHRRDGCQRV